MSVGLRAWVPFPIVVGVAVAFACLRWWVPCAGWVGVVAGWGMCERVHVVANREAERRRAMVARLSQIRREP